MTSLPSAQAQLQDSERVYSRAATSLENEQDSDTEVNLMNYGAFQVSFLQIWKKKSDSNRLRSKWYSWHHSKTPWKWHFPPIPWGWEGIHTSIANKTDHLKCKAAQQLFSSSLQHELCPGWAPWRDTPQGQASISGGTNTAREKLDLGHADFTVKNDVELQLLIFI